MPATRTADTKAELSSSIGVLSFNSNVNVTFIIVYVLSNAAESASAKHLVM